MRIMDLVVLADFKNRPTFSSSKCFYVSYIINLKEGVVADSRGTMKCRKKHKQVPVNASVRSVLKRLSKAITVLGIFVNRQTG